MRAGAVMRRVSAWGNDGVSFRLGAWRDFRFRSIAAAGPRHYDVLDLAGLDKKSRAAELSWGRIL